MFTVTEDAGNMINKMWGKQKAPHAFRIRLQPG